jgi:hypothetical protein
VRNNRISCLNRFQSACISIASSQNVIIEDNQFSAKTEIDYRFIIDDVVDPETKMSHPELDVKNVYVKGNIYKNISKLYFIKVKEFSSRNCNIE